MVKVIYRGPSALAFHTTPSGRSYDFLPGVPTDVTDAADVRLFKGKSDFEVLDLKKKVEKKLKRGKEDN